jgi:hypothetical protein
VVEYARGYVRSGRRSAFGVPSSEQSACCFTQTHQVFVFLFSVVGPPGGTGKLPPELFLHAEESVVLAYDNMVDKIQIEEISCFNQLLCGRLILF